MAFWVQNAGMNAVSVSALYPRSAGVSSFSPARPLAAATSRANIATADRFMAFPLRHSVFAIIREPDSVSNTRQPLLPAPRNRIIQLHRLPYPDSLLGA